MDRNTADRIDRFQRMASPSDRMWTYLNPHSDHFQRHDGRHRHPYCSQVGPAVGHQPGVAHCTPNPDLLSRVCSSSFVGSQCNDIFAMKPYGSSSFWCMSKYYKVSLHTEV